MALFAFCFVLFAFVAQPTQAQLLIDQTGMYRPDTSDEGFETYSFTKRVLGGHTYNKNGTESVYFKFSGNVIYKKQYGNTYEYHYDHNENGCRVYYFYVGYANDPIVRSSYLLVSSDRRTINSVDVSSGQTDVFKKGKAPVQGMIE